MNLEYLSVISKALSFPFLDIGSPSTKSRYRIDSGIFGYSIGYSNPYS